MDELRERASDLRRRWDARAASVDVGVGERASMVDALAQLEAMGSEGAWSASENATQEAICWHVLGGDEGGALMGAWVAQRGFWFAWRVLVAVTLMHPARQAKRPGLRIGRRATMAELPADGLLHLRRLGMEGRDVTSRSALVAEARDRRARAESPVARAGIDVLVPEQPDWALEDAERWLETPGAAEPAALGVLLGAVRDPDIATLLALEAVERQLEKVVRPYLGLLAEEMGARAFPALQVMLEDCRHRAYRPALVRALIACRAPEAIPVLLDELLRGSDITRGLARAFFVSEPSARAAQALRTAAQALESDTARKGAAARRRQVASLQSTLDEMVARRTRPTMRAWSTALPPGHRPGWLDPASLPAVEEEGEALSSPERVRIACSAAGGHLGRGDLPVLRGVADFAEALLGQWLNAKAPTRDAGVVRFAIAFGDQRVRQPLAAHVEALAKEKRAAAIEPVCDGLAREGNGWAPKLLGELRWCGRNRALRDCAEKAAARLAAERGASVERVCPAPTTEPPHGFRRALVQRMEAAMLAVSGWRPADFRALFDENPIAAEVADQVLWGVVGPKGDSITRPFRRRDRPSGLSDDTTLTPVHPVLLTPRQLGRWRRAFHAAGVEPPFAQLERAIARLGAVDLDALTSAWRACPRTSVTGLTTRGWRLVSLDPTKPRWEQIERRVGELRLVLDIEPGLHTREQAPWRNPEQVRVRLRAQIPADPDPIVFSEAVGSVMALLTP